MKEQSTCPSCSLENERLNKGKEISHDSKMIEVVEVIVGGFTKGGLNNNAYKRHL